MKEEMTVLFLILGIILGIPIGVLLAELLGAGKKPAGILFERDEKGNIIGILPVDLKS